MSKKQNSELDNEQPGTFESEEKEKILDYFLSKAQQKVLKATTTVLLIGGLLFGAANINIPNSCFSIINNKTATCTAINFEDLDNKDLLDPTGKRFIVKKETTDDYINVSKMIIENNTIKVCYQEGLSKDYVESVEKACELYQNIFDIINPTIKVELDNSNINNCDIYINKLASDEEEYEKYAMDTSRLYYQGYNNVWQRVDVAAIISIYNATDEKKQCYKNLAVAHEFGHAICGFEDYHKSDEFLKHYGVEKQPDSIMNYNFFNKINSFSETPKITTFDLALMVKQWGFFQDNEYKDESQNFFTSKEEYYDYINSKLGEVCYNDTELKLAENSIIAYDGKMSFIDYIKVITDDGSVNSPSNEE